MKRPKPQPPRPTLVRRPWGPYGWLDARLLRDGWLARLGSDATAVLTLLSLAADRHGASFYGRDKMGLFLGLDRSAVDHALDRLLALGLVDHRPWRPGLPDGVWQLLPLPVKQAEPRGGDAVSVADVVRRLMERGEP
jgi:hypothetical protein